MNNKKSYRVGARALMISAISMCLAVSAWGTATWTRLANLTPSSVGSGTMLLLTDGTVLAQAGYSQDWWRLTPDSTGSYVNGTWSSVSPMPAPRLYYSSQVLPNGQVWLMGGEYYGPNLDEVETATGLIWDPIANTWSPVANFIGQPCGNVTYNVSGNTAAGSNVISGLPTSVTSAFLAGWNVSGPGITPGATIVSVGSGQVTISTNVSFTQSQVTLAFSGLPTSCYGDLASVLLPGGRIFTGSHHAATYIYTLATNSWSFAANRVNDSADEFGFTKLPDGRILSYDVYISQLTGLSHAEVYDPTTNTWSSISPADGSANGTLPLLASSSSEIGPQIQLLDGRIFIVGATGHTALYTPSTNTWAAGPDIIGTLNGNPTVFGADDAPAAVMPNGHVLFTADAAPAAVNSTGNTAAGSSIITNIPSTANLYPGWAVSQPDGSTTVIPQGTTISNVISATSVQISNNANATASNVSLEFGGAYSNPTEIFDFDPNASTISAVSPSLPDANLNESSFGTRMLVLPTGQVLFSDGSSQLWVYTPNGAAASAYQPVVSNVAYNGGGVFTLTGTQLTGLTAGASYGDDVQMDENYPIVSLSANGHVYYCRTTNWSSVGIATGSTPQTVNFALNPAVTAGTYSLTVSAAGISSAPIPLTVTQSEVTGLGAPTKIVVTPATSSISVNSTQQYAATSTYSDGSTQDVTVSATWTSSAPGVATISNTGLATGVSAGATNITASFSGVTSASAALTVTTGSQATASFVMTDSTTSGNWVGKYGQDGGQIANDMLIGAPAYATDTYNAALYTWAASTSDQRAPYVSDAVTGRIASASYGSPSFSINVNLADNNTHQVALYFLDWDRQGRAETVSILDAKTNTVLDTKTVSNFQNGIYLVWNLHGNVNIQITQTAGSNAVLSGIFFGPLPTTPPTVSITTPASGATVSGKTVTVMATASAATPATVTSVQFQLDGANLGSAVTTAPYTITWDSTTAKNGSHSLTAIATDSNGQKGASLAVPVTVSNPTTTPPPTVAITTPANNSTVVGSVTVAATVSSSAPPVSVQFQVDGANLGSPVTAAPYSISWNSLLNSPGLHVLTAIATDSLGQVTTSAPVNVTAVIAEPPPPHFIKTDATTSGNWVGTYGKDGTLIANDSQAALPSYVTVTPATPQQYTWADPTNDPRALYASSAANGRIASTYYSGSSFTFDINPTDGNSHQVALYALDFDRQGRTETIDMLYGASGAVIDTHTISGFGGGVYLVWNIYGHVIIRVTNAGPVNAVVSGLFFDPQSSSPTAIITAPLAGATVSGAVPVTAIATATLPVAVASVQFQLDGANLGSPVTASPYTISWDTTKTKNGSHTLTAIVTDSIGQQGTSSAVSVTVSNPITTPPPIVAISAPSAGATVSGKATTVAATVSSTAPAVSVQFQLDGVNLGSAVGAAPYSISWDTTTASNATHSITAVATDSLGQSTTSSPVSVTVSNPVSSGASVTFLKTDTTTLGNWVGKYGQNGGQIANDTLITAPAFASVTSTAALYTWASPAADPRAPYTSNAATGRIASAFYASPGFMMSVNLTDNVTHQVALYLLDWDQEGRAETVSILDASTNKVLDTKTVSNFQNGVYLVWNIEGNVTIQFTKTAGQNAVLSGIFFGSTSTPPTAGITTPANGATVSGKAVAIAANASATSPATVSSVQFQLDGVNLGTPVTASPYTISWDSTTAKNGTHMLTAIVTDSTGQQGTSPAVSVTVANSITTPPPTVAVSAPSAGATLSGTATTVAATVSSAAPSVSVQFQLDGVNLGTAVTNSPYSISWDTTKTTNGTHSLTAIATDSLGQATTSSPVSVTVTNTVATATATFVKTDSTTVGNWVGKYGANGGVIANDLLLSPASYASVTTTAPQYTWASSPADQKAPYASSAATGRIASAFYASPGFTMNLSFSDNNTHQVALYFLDWDQEGRAETISILDASTSKVLATDTVSNFQNGVYVVWNIQGNVKIQFNQTAGQNAVVTGIFFGPTS